ncbi:MAG: hypothetical protein JJU24_11000 [Natronohydrobacter sp.]|nr:hypothetical protein [Natronohydrobacter sp.]
MLADSFAVTPQANYKWRKRDSVEDRSHTPHRLQTTLTPAQEAVAVGLRKTLLVSRDDLLAVVREFLNPYVSRSGLDRCLRRHGVGNLRDLQAKAARPKRSGFKAYEPGYIHIDVKYLPQMTDETSRRYSLITIPARGFRKCRTSRPHRRPHSITRQQGQKLLALRAATTEGSWCFLASLPATKKTLKYRNSTCLGFP